MVTNNPYYIQTEINKPIETVYEIKGDEHQLPSFEEFMKDYQADEKVNYADLESGDIGNSKGYGPCTSYYCPHTKEELQQQLRQAEAEKDRLKREAKNDIEGFWNKFRQLDKEWEDYRGAVNYIFTSREEIEEAAKWGGFIVHASPFPVSSEIYDGILSGVKKFDENEQRKTTNTPKVAFTWFIIFFLMKIKLLKNHYTRPSHEFIDQSKFGTFSTIYIIRFQ